VRPAPAAAEALVSRATSPSAEALLNVARQLILQAADRLTELAKQPLTRERKHDASLVTNADHEVDRLIRDGLRAAFPDHAVLTEESGLHRAPESPFVWAVDPLDGTRAYAKGIPGFSVMIGLLKDGAPYLGLVADPLEGYCYEAARGVGAFLTNRAGERTPLRVSQRNAWTQMPLITSTGFPQTTTDAVNALLGSPFVAPINSVGIKVGLVVRQVADIYLNHHLVSYWDTCAPQIILEEAGGRFTMIDGSPLTYRLADSHVHPRPTIASNGTRHNELVKLLTPLTSQLRPLRRNSG